MKLSAYTEAKNCTDINDINGGIEDVKTAIAAYKDANKKIPSYFYIRLAKLRNKLEKFQRQKEQTFSVTVNFSIDIHTLEQAIRYCLFYNNEPSKKSVIDIVKVQVQQSGKKIIDYPEYWGDDLITVDYKEVEKYLVLLAVEFELTNNNKERS